VRFSPPDLRAILAFDAVSTFLPKKKQQPCRRPSFTSFDLLPSIYMHLTGFCAFPDRTAPDDPQPGQFGSFNQAILPWTGATFVYFSEPLGFLSPWSSAFFPSPPRRQSTQPSVLRFFMGLVPSIDPPPGPPGVKGFLWARSS